MPDRYGDTTPPPPEPITDPDVKRQRAELIAAAIEACTLCDADGYRGVTVCDHTDHAPINARGMANLRRTMGWPEPAEAGRDA